MLPKENRLNKKSDFVLVSKKGEVVQSKNFGLAYLSTNKKEAPKFGFIVSNKISKKAVDRNRIKRILRQIARELVSDIGNGLLFVLLTRKSVLDANPEALKGELTDKLKQVGAIK